MSPTATYEPDLRCLGIAGDASAPLAPGMIQSIKRILAMTDLVLATTLTREQRTCLLTVRETAQAMLTPSRRNAAPPFNLTYVMEQIGGDRTLLADLIEIFRQEVPDIFAQIDRAMAVGDAAGLDRAAHRLRGSVASLGATRAADAALVLETIGRERNLATAPEAIAVLEREMSDLCEALVPHSRGGRSENPDRG